MFFESRINSNGTVNFNFVGTSLPSEGKCGDCYYDVDKKIFYMYYNNDWIELSKDYGVTTKTSTTFCDSNILEKEYPKEIKKFNCPNCGAPQLQIKYKGQYYCPYCDSLLYAS